MPLGILIHDSTGRGLIEFRRSIAVHLEEATPANMNWAVTSFSAITLLPIKVPGLAAERCPLTPTRRIIVSESVKQSRIILDSSTHYGGAVSGSIGQSIFR